MHCVDCFQAERPVEICYVRDGCKDGSVLQQDIELTSVATSGGLDMLTAEACFEYLIGILILECSLCVDRRRRGCKQEPQEPSSPNQCHETHFLRAGTKHGNDCWSYTKQDLGTTQSILNVAARIAEEAVDHGLDEEGVLARTRLCLIACVSTCSVEIDRVFVSAIIFRDQVELVRVLLEPRSELMPRSKEIMGVNESHDNGGNS